MGASTDYRVFEAADWAAAEEKALQAIAAARYEYGHGGYSGTIAEAQGVKALRRPPMTEREAEALAFGGEADEGVAQKWGPGILLQLTEGRWFFGAVCSS